MVVEFGIALFAVILRLCLCFLALELVGEKAIMCYFNKANWLLQALHIAVTGLVITAIMGKLEKATFLLKIFKMLKHVAKNV